MRKTLIAMAVALAVLFGSLNAAPAFASSLDKKKDKSKKEKGEATEAEKTAKSEEEKVDKKSKKEKGSKSSKKSAEAKSLYTRLGGKKAITAVVDDFVANVAADDRINKFFADTAKDPARLAAFKGKLVDQICEATGGPCKYTGLDMKTAHKGLALTDADFTALVEDLVKSLDKFKVGETEKNELLGALGSMKADIVGQ